MKYIFLCLIFAVSLFANNTNKYLKSQIRAEVYAQNLIEGGYYKKANEFLNKARDKYPSSESLYMFSATTSYNLKDFDNSKIYIIKTLSINPMNEEATRYKNMITAQEKAKRNQVLVGLFNYLSDKGLDFILIFLAFLGGEIIARRYSSCSSTEIQNIAKQYKYRFNLDKSIIFKIKFALQNYFEFKNIISFCTFLNILVVFIISCSLLIFWLFIELTFSLNLFTYKPLELMNLSEISIYSVYLFIVFVLFTVFIQIILYISYLEQNPLKVQLKLSQYLDDIVQRNNLTELYDIVKEFNSLNISIDEILFDSLCDETKEKLNYIYKLQV